jgi:gamma-D-glutamyl-L-lysine dipeptidyl-peptidase
MDTKKINMQYGACCVPVSSLRKEPSHTSEMVSQQLFGERCTLLETGADNWIKIQAVYDDYTGWCQQNHLIEIDDDDFEERRKALTTGWINTIEYDHQTMHVPFGSCLAGCKKRKGTLGNKPVVYNGKVWRPEHEKITNKKIKKIACKFINTPYLWGGKSVFGIDCSGFSQTVYKFLDISLPRDAWQQAEGGETVSGLGKAKRGDLLFFDNGAGKITHVGILLNQSEIIHSSGKVRVDKIDTQGIINISTNQRTHKLRLIKRYIS